jgi:predicted nucleotide-binding protein
MPIAEARSKLDERIKKGRKIKASSVQSEEDMELARGEYQKWSDYNTELLKRMFTSEDLAKEYSRSIGVSVARFQPSLSMDLKDLHSDIDDKIQRLDSIAERLELIPLASSVSPPAARVSGPRARDQVFLVHGHDDAARESVARFLEKLSLKPVILHEQANRGKTIIEKLEQHSNVNFAVVLLTADDEARKMNSTTPLKPRARQNVVLELGYFIGKLGREGVCALYGGEVEIPSNYLGVLFVPLDAGGAWKLKLAKELKEADFDIETLI